MKVLVASASKYGATEELAEAIATVLSERGLDSVALPVGEVESIEGYDAVVIGSAVYMGRWLDPARDLVHRLAASLSQRPVWLFSSGPIGDPPMPAEDPVDVADLVAATHAREHRVFAGKLDMKVLSFQEKALVLSFHAPEGDFRDWTSVKTWASQIADALNPA